MIADPFCMVCGVYPCACEKPSTQDELTKDNLHIKELEARIAELRGALETVRINEGRSEVYRNSIITKSLSRPDDFSALNEAKAKVLEEMATFFESGDVNRALGSAAHLRRRAQEIREGGK